jgi:hypothetical protein
MLVAAMSDPVFIIECFGDLLRDRVMPPTACASLPEALEVIARVFPGWDDDSDEVLSRPEDVLLDRRTVYPDPEDDRIVVWRAQAGEPVVVVWHFSGWHWEGDAADLPGGPLPQGALPGDSRSMYEIAMSEY